MLIVAMWKDAPAWANNVQKVSFANERELKEFEFCKGNILECHYAGMINLVMITHVGQDNEMQLIALDTGNRWTDTRTKVYDLGHITFEELGVMFAGGAG